METKRPSCDLGNARHEALRRETRNGRAPVDRFPTAKAADRKDIRPSELPFHWPNGTDPVTTWGPLGSGEFRDFPTALTAGTTMMTAPGESWVQEGRYRVLPGRARYVLLQRNTQGRSVHRDCVIPAEARPPLSQTHLARNRCEGDAALPDRPKARSERKVRALSQGHRSTLAGSCCQSCRQSFRH